MLRKIFKNSSYLVAAQLISKIAAFLYGLFLANTLGVANFGLYSVALSYFSLISSFTDFGVSRYLIRESARDESKIPVIFTNSLILKLGVTLLIYVVFATGLFLFDPDNLRLGLTLLTVLTIFPQLVGLTIDGVFVAKQKLLYSAWGLLVLNFSNFLLGYFLILNGWGIFGAAISLVISHIIFAFFFIFIVRNDRIFKLKMFDPRLIRHIFINSVPYGVLGLLGLIYFKIDTLLLSYLKGPYDTGIYAFAYRFLEAIVFIPSSIAVAIFPVFAKLHDTDLESLRKYYHQSLKVMGIASVVIFLGYVTALPILITFLPPLHQFIPAIDPILILAITIPFMFLQTPAVQVLFSTEKFLYSIIVLSLITLAFNVVLNLIFIPLYGYMAAAWITVASEVFSFTVFYLFLRVKVFIK